MSHPELRPDPRAAYPEPTPRSALFRLAAALAVTEFAPVAAFTKADPDTRVLTRVLTRVSRNGSYHDHDHDADWPALCEVCEQPARPDCGLYCSPEHRRIIEGSPLRIR